MAANRSFDTSHLPVYVPTGHGELSVKNGKLVERRVPEGCVFITFAYSGIGTWNTMFEKFLLSLKDPEVMRCFQNPTLPENVLALRQYFEPHMFAETAIFSPEDDGILSVNLPGETYIDAVYHLVGDFEKHTFIADSGFYRAETLVKKDIQILGKIPDRAATSFRHILDCFNGSIIPGPKFINDKLAKPFARLIAKGKTPTSEIRRATYEWPFLESYNDFISDEEFDTEMLTELAVTTAETEGDGYRHKTPVDIFIRLLRAIREELRGLPDLDTVTKRKKTEELRHLRTFVRVGWRMLERAQAELQRSRITHYPVISSLHKLFSELHTSDFRNVAMRDGELTISGFVDEIKVMMKRLEIEMKRDTLQFPGNPIKQSFLFKNYPGIHVNFLCRYPEVGKAVSSGEIEAQRRLSDERRAMLNANMARVLEESRALIGPGRLEAEKEAARERQLEMARLVELNRLAKMNVDPYSYREPLVPRFKETISEENLTEMRSLVRSGRKGLSNTTLPSGSVRSTRSTRRSSNRSAARTRSNRT